MSFICSCQFDFESLYETSGIDWCEVAVLMKWGMCSVCDCSSLCVEESLLVWSKIILEGENVCNSHNNMFLVWGENLYSLLYSGLNLVDVCSMDQQGCVICGNLGG
jgi:hypothetical protein